MKSTNNQTQRKTANSKVKIRLVCQYLACLCLCFLLTSCFDDLFGQNEKLNDLQEARNFINQNNFMEAEKSFERYLRRNPDGNARWEVWNSLVDIATDVRHSSRSAQEIMETMLIEYENDPYRLRVIRGRLATEYERNRKNDRGLTLWGELASDEAATSLQRADGYRGLSRIYLRRLEFSSVTDALQGCLDLTSLPEEMVAQCRYDLADAYIIMEKNDESITVLRAILADKSMNDELRIMAVFNLADVLEQKGEKVEALSLFESIKESYPNPKVVEIRIDFLKKGKK